MEELIKLEEKITDRLCEIRNKDTKTLNEIEEYKKLQEDLRKVSDVVIMIRRMESD